MTAQETGPAKNRDETLVGGGDGHGAVGTP
jgi:hypothetical protein